MDSTQLTERIARAKQLLQTAQNAAMATVNDDGTPHNTPFWLIHDNQLKNLYWISYPTSRHSQNIERDGQLFVVLYEANAGGGLYIDAAEGHVVRDDELDAALNVLSDMRKANNKEPQDKSFFTKPGGQRLYQARPLHFYVNGSQKDAAGQTVGDVRLEITADDLRY